MFGRFFAITSIGLVVFWFRRDPKVLKHYEQTFVDTYSPLYSNQVIPSPFHESPRLMAKLCGHSAIRRNLVKSRPTIKIHRISFATIRKPFLVAEVIRCTRHRAIIQAPPYLGHDCAYLLQFHRGVPPSFRIHRKFCYINKKSHGIKRSVNGVKIQHIIPEDSHQVPDSHEQDSHEHDSHEEDHHHHHHHDRPINEDDFPDYVASHETTPAP